jgi:hypothetical protein
MPTIASPPPSEASAASNSQEVLTSRMIGGAAIAALAIYVLILGIDAATPMVLLTLPLVIGAVVSVIASDEVSGRIDAWGNSFEAKLNAARGAQGAFNRWFKRPLYGGFAFLWRVTRPIQYRHIRGWSRLSDCSILAG